MRLKIFIALSVAIIMLVTLAMPVLADRAAGTLHNESGVTGIGKYSIRTTHDNYLKVTVSLRGAMAETEYRVWVSASGISYWREAGRFTTNARGSGRFSGFATIAGTSNPDPRVFDPGDVAFRVYLFPDANYDFYSDAATVHFK